MSARIHVLAFLLLVTLGMCVFFVGAQSVFAREDYFRPGIGDAIGNINGLERAVVTSEGGLNLYEETGDIVAGYPLFIQDSVPVTSPVLTDMSGDNKDEIVFVARDSNDSYSLYVYGGDKTLIDSLVLGDGVFFDPVSLKIPGAVKKSVVIATDSGQIFDVKVENGKFISAKIIDARSAIGVAADSTGTELILNFPQQKKISIYAKENGAWVSKKDFNTAQILFPMVYGLGNVLYGINSSNELVAIDKTSGQYVPGFPVKLNSSALDSPIFSDVDEQNPGLELMVPLSGLKSAIFDQRGTILDDSYVSKSFIETGGFVADPSQQGVFAAIHDYAVALYKKVANFIASFLGGFRLTVKEFIQSNVYEDAEDGTLSRWSYSSGAFPLNTISNIADDPSQGRVIALDLSQYKDTYYNLTRANGSLWHNTESAVLSWDMKTSEETYIYADVETSLGNRHLMYSFSYRQGMDSKYASFNLDAKYKDGTWHRIIRDLQSDMDSLEKGNVIQEVNALWVGAGPVKIDNVTLLGKGDLHKILGTLTDVDGKAIAGAVITLEPDKAIRVSDQNGNYSFASVIDGTYTIKPLHEDYVFDPLSAQVIIAGNDQVQNFSATSANAFIYEDAEDGTINGWRYSGGAMPPNILSNVQDDMAHGRAIAVDMTGIKDQFLELNRDDGTPWNNAKARILQWDLKTANELNVYAHVMTDAGVRNVWYSFGGKPGLDGNYISINLNKSLQDNAWHTVTRDLQADIESLEKGVNITSVTSFWIAGGPGLIDNVKLLKTANNIFKITGVVLDANNAPIPGVTVKLSPDSVSSTTDQNGNYAFGNLQNGAYTLTPTLDGYVFNPVSANVTINSGNQTQNFTGTKNNVFIYEDAEDGTVSRWTYSGGIIQPNTISNVADDIDHGRAIEMDLSAFKESFFQLNKNGGPWNNAEAKTLELDMKTDKETYFYVDLETDAGGRRLMYSFEYRAGKLDPVYLSFNLDPALKDNAWHTLQRDLQADLTSIENGVNITKVNYFWVGLGPARLDNIKLIK